MAARFRSNVDHTRLISKSIFVMNLPDNTTSKDLWEVCQGYGTVVDVYIPNRKSKAGKRFAFLHFIKVENVDRLVGNLCTLWIGRMHLHANVGRFERSPIHSSLPTNPIRSDNTGAPSFASALKGNPNISLPISSSPAMVLDDSCVVKHDLDNYVMGEVKQFSSINNLSVLLSNESTLVSHLGLVAYAMPNRNLYLGNESFGLTLRVYLCTLGHTLLLIRSSLDEERAKELFVWSPVFKDVAEVVYYSDDESVKGADENNVKTSKQVNLDAESDVEGVSETYFGEHDDNLGNDQDPIQRLNEKETSNDPFNVYDLLKKHDKGEVNSGLDTSFPYPPRFTPEKDNLNIDVQEVKGTDQAKSHSRSEGLCSSGSILEVLDDMIKVGQTMGFSMEGCLGSKAKKEWIRELDIKHRVNFLTFQETKMDSISAMDVKLLWGNYNFDQVFSEDVGNSGGILCSWDSNVFHKEQHIISDNFIALYGTWNANKAKLLMISIYGPQSATVRCMEDRMGSVFNMQWANEFNNFISNSGLVEVQLEGYSFTWSHPLATKMSKLDRFLVTEGLVSLFPHISGICLDRHLSDYRPILLREVITDYGAMPFGMYHSWFSLHGFEQMVTHTWNSIVLDDRNGMVRFKKKMQFLKKEIQVNFRFPNRLNPDQVVELENPITRDEIRNAVCACGENKSLGPDGFTFEFFRKFWNIIGSDLCVAVEWFFDHSSFTKGCNSSFVALIPKTHDPKYVSDYRPISLIGSLYKVVTKILATRLSMVIFDLISDVQTAFLPNRQILDGPFIINELLSWCKHKKQQAMVFKVDFAKAYNSIRWDYLDDVLRSFGFGSKWCSWISGSLILGMTSILINGSLTSEFQFHCGLKQGDPLAHYLFILIMEYLHLSFSRAVDAGIFTG
nr:RNA-directed DNA polymerase, eukaryota [Tanacetum cinerariifolium]